MLGAGDRIFTVYNGENTVGIITKVLEETVTHEDGPLDWAYDVTRVAARLFPDEEGQLPRLADLLVTVWESDADLLSDTETTYGWVHPGDRFEGR